MWANSKALPPLSDSLAGIHEVTGGVGGIKVNGFSFKTLYGLETRAQI